MMGGQLQALLEMKGAEELQVRNGSHAARKTSARFRRSELTSVDMVFMFRPHSTTSDGSHVLWFQTSGLTYYFSILNNVSPECDETKKENNFYYR